MLLMPSVLPMQIYRVAKALSKAGAKMRVAVMTGGQADKLERDRVLRTQASAAIIAAGCTRLISMQLHTCDVYDEVIYIWPSKLCPWSNGRGHLQWVVGLLDKVVPYILWQWELPYITVRVTGCIQKESWSFFSSSEPCFACLSPAEGDACGGH